MTRSRARASMAAIHGAGQGASGGHGVDEAKQYIDEGHFAPGSMLPKVQAAVDFAESKPGRQALITLLEKAKDGILGKTGTRIHL